MSIRAKNPGRGRARFSALVVLFLWFFPSLLLEQAPTSDIRNAATAGDAQAQFALANYYFRARYLTLDYPELVTWSRNSSNQGFAPAQNQLASMYENRIGVPLNNNTAQT